MIPGLDMPSKPHLTVQEKILIHLLEHTKYEDRFELPYSLTQDGIAEVVGVRRSYVSSANRELIEKGLLAEKLSHVKGEARRRKTYYLSPEGKAEAEKLRSQVKKMKVVLRDGKGKRKVTLDDIERLTKKKLSTLQVLDAISENGVFDALSKPPLKPAHIDFSHTYPRPRYFFGRESELKEINEWMKSEEMKILAVKGIAGIGKTTLMAKVAGEEKEKRIFWYKFHNWSTLRNLLTHFSDFLTQEGKDALKLYLEENRVMDVGDVQALLKNQLGDIQALLIFDDFHRANQRILAFFEALTEVLYELEDIKLVLLGREIPKFYDRRDVLVSRLVGELQLKGLDKTSSLELLKLRKIDSEHLDAIYESTKGHPLSLELVELSKGEIGKRNIEQFLQEEVLKRLGDKEKRLLRFASVFRYPVHPEAYLSISRKDKKEKITHETIDDLVDMSLLTAPDSLYDVHDVIREFFYQRLSRELKMAYHLKVAEYFEDEADDLALVEAQYHHIKAENQNRAVELALQYGEHLINRGYLEEFLKILDSVDKEKVALKYLITLLTMEGDALTTLGEWNRAIELHEESLQAAKELKDERGIAQAYYKIAAIHYRKGALDEALSLNNKSLKILKEGKEPIELAKLYNNIGVIHWKKGEFKKAIENYNKSLEIAEDLGDGRGIARAFNNLGIIHWEKGKLDDAVGYYKRSLEIADQLGDRQTVAILYDNLGEAYRMKEDMDKALVYYKKSLDLSEKLGFRWQIAEVYRNIGNVYEGEEGKKYLERAYEMFLSLGAEKDAEELMARLQEL
jgi:ATP/maltotriose-dependent transcriptional regulator MalT/DNA-binding MarR family transcriptional regulator